MAKQFSFVDEAEMVAEDVAKWGADVIIAAIHALAPDGRGWGEEKLNEREEMQLYMKKLRGNQEAWADWITERVKQIVGKMMEAGVPEEVAYQVHPYSIVQSQAIKYAFTMEKRLAREQEKWRASLNATRADELELDMLPTGTGGN